MYDKKYFFPNKNKFNAKKTNYNGGRFDSNFEAQYAMMLDMAKAAGDIKKYDKQITLDLKVNGYHITNYRIDFIVHHLDGSREFVETKGYETYEWRIKWKLLEALFETFKESPDDCMTLVKQKNWGPPQRRNKKK